jgi:hypothetical protein
MSSELKNRAQGLTKEVGGKLEKAAGKLLGNEGMAEAGNALESNGRAQAEAGKGHAKGISTKQIKPDLPVVCSNGGQFAVVDHMQGPDSIKLKKDEHGLHHFIPLSWVTKVDGSVHVDRPGEQAMKEWRTEVLP